MAKSNWSPFRADNGECGRGSVRSAFISVLLLLILFQMNAVIAAYIVYPSRGCTCADGCAWCYNGCRDACRGGTCQNGVCVITPCSPSYTNCGSWGACSASGTQTRDCYDVSCGNTAPQTQTQTCVLPPTSSLSSDVITGKAPLTVTFSGYCNNPGDTSQYTNPAVRNLVSCDLSYGDSTAQEGFTTFDRVPPFTGFNYGLTGSLSHMYVSEGTYTAKLTAKNSKGAVSSPYSITINVLPSNRAPTASLSSSRTVGSVPMTASFSATCADSDGTITSCAINFGDGSSSNVDSATVTHTYVQQGTYSAVLTATDNKGATSTSSVSIYTNPNTLPTAALSADVSSGMSPLVVGFTPTCTDSDGSVTACIIDFGDGTPSQSLSTKVTYTRGPSQCSPRTCPRGRMCAAVVICTEDIVEKKTASTSSTSHTYSSAGKFSAVLTAIDDSGASVRSSPISITIGSPTTGKITDASIKLESSIRGVKSRATLKFTTTNAIPLGGSVNVSFKGGFSLLRPGNSVSCGILPNMARESWPISSVSLDGIMFTRPQSSSGSTGGSQTVECVINGMTNPSAIGASSDFDITTRDSGGALIDSGKATPPLIGQQGQLTNIAIIRSIIQPGAISSVDFSFTTTNPLPSDGAVKITFPSGFSVSSAAASCPTISGSTQVSVSGMTVIISRTGDGDTEQPGNEKCTVSNVMNPASSGPVGQYRIETSDRKTRTTGSQQQAQTCVPEGGSLGAVVPGNTNECCPGLVAKVPTGPGGATIVGTRGTCARP